VGVPARLEAAYRVRFDETGADSRLRASGYVRYAQDLAWRHSEAAGLDRAWYAARGTFWLVRCLALRLTGHAMHGDELTVSTEVTGWHRVWARRRSLVWRAGDVLPGAAPAPLAEVITDWVLLTTEGHPTGVPAEIMRTFTAGNATFTPNHVRLAPTPPGAREHATDIHVHQVDPMGHVNNAGYVDLVDEALWAMGVAVPAAEYRLEYVRAATGGMRVRASSWPVAEGRLACRLAGPDGTELCRILVMRAGGTPDGPT
jgi:acyl-CoA thioesterase FadM